MISGSHASATTGYVCVFAGLLVLTALTVSVAFVDLGGLNNTVALLIASGKAWLVVAFFMHVRHGSALVKSTITAGCAWLAILIGLTMSDFLTRSW